MSTLVAYFSAEGTTAKVAKEFAEKLTPHVAGARAVDAVLVKNASEL